VPFETLYWIEVHAPPRPVVVHSSYVRPPEPHASAVRQVVPPLLASSPASASAVASLLASASADASIVLESPPEEEPASPEGAVAQYEASCCCTGPQFMQPAHVNTCPSLTWYTMAEHWPPDVTWVHSS
jgi:hypothetical protein